MEQAALICKQHYSMKDASSCDRYPLSRECRSGCGAGQEALNNWRQNLEAKAVTLV